MKYLLFLLIALALASCAFAVTLVKDGKALSAIYVEPAVMAPDDKSVERPPLHPYPRLALSGRPGETGRGRGVEHG